MRAVAQRTVVFIVAIVAVMMLVEIPWRLATPYSPASMMAWDYLVVVGAMAALFGPGALMGFAITRRKPVTTVQAGLLGALAFALFMAGEELRSRTGIRMEYPFGMVWAFALCGTIATLGGLGLPRIRSAAP